MADETLRRDWSDPSRQPSVLERLFLLVHPPTIRRRTIEFRHTYHLGMAAASIWLVLIATGLLMMVHVRPTAPDIYRDLKDLQFTVEYGALIRNVHYWAASAMVTVVVLHMLRVFFQRAYLSPRRATWSIGVGLFVLTFLSAHTGYLLPWDQRAYWGIEIAATMASQVPLIGEHIRFLVLGGNTIGPNAVLRIYVLHCFVIPGATALLVAGHLRSLRRTGGHDHVSADGRAAAPAPERGSAIPGEEPIAAFPHLLLREILVLQSVAIVLVSLALTWSAPLDELANPLKTPDPVKAPWYFVGLQELLHYFPPVVVGLIVPALIVGVLIMVPFVAGAPRAWLAGSQRTAVARGLGAVMLGASVLLAATQAWIALVPTVAIELVAFWSARPPVPDTGVRGWLGRRSPIEWIVIWLIAVAAAVTLTGSLFRGPGWTLVWPTAAVE